MKIPDRAYQLPGGVNIRVKDVDVEVWQAHVVKHPLGLGALRRQKLDGGTCRWDAEGWNRLEPPVVKESQRVRVAREIQGMEAGSVRCGVRDLELLESAGTGEIRKLECYACPVSLAEMCSAATREITDGYARVVNDACRVLEDAVEISRRAFCASLWAAVEGGDVPTVAGVGDFSNGNGFGLRVNCANGVRFEACADTEHWGDFHWRTTYRVAVKQRTKDLISHLTHLPRSHSDDLLSGNVLVPRLWWERNSR